MKDDCNIFRISLNSQKYIISFPNLVEGLKKIYKFMKKSESNSPPFLSNSSISFTLFNLSSPLPTQPSQSHNIMAPVIKMRFLFSLINKPKTLSFLPISFSALNIFLPFFSLIYFSSKNCKKLISIVERYISFIYLIHKKFIMKMLLLSGYN